MMSGQTIVQVDAFTNERFAGNAAGVCVMAEAGTSAWMQQLARETNLAATVFLSSRARDFHIRWFTPAHELPLCGHGTLAAAHTLWTEGYVPVEQQITFHYRSGTLTAVRKDDWITLDFPAIPTFPAPAPEALLCGLGAEPRQVSKSHHSYLVEVGSEQEVRALVPDIGRLAQLDIANVIVTSRAASGDFDFISRFFAPSHGIAEDAVTGSAHCCLGPYWAERLDKTTMVGYQASARGGVVRVQVSGDRVGLSGQAVTVLRGRLVR